MIGLIGGAGADVSHVGREGRERELTRGMNGWMDDDDDDGGGGGGWMDGRGGAAREEERLVPGLAAGRSGWKGPTCLQVLHVGWLDGSG